MKKIGNNRGIGLVETLVVAGVFYGVAATTMFLFSNIHNRTINSIKRESMVTNLNTIRSLLSSERFCTATLAGVDPSLKTYINSIKNRDNTVVFNPYSDDNYEQTKYKITEMYVSNYQVFDDPLYGIAKFSINFVNDVKGNEFNYIKSFLLQIKLGDATSPTPNQVVKCASFAGEEIGEGTQWSTTGSITNYEKGPVSIGMHFAPKNLSAGDLAISGTYKILGENFYKASEKEILCLGPNQCNPSKTLFNPPGDQHFYALGKMAGDGSNMLGLFVGYKAGLNSQSSSSTSYNLFVGAESGLNLVGNENIALGYKAGEGFSGSENVIIGRGAGKNSKGDRNTYIGTAQNFNALDATAVVGGVDKSVPITSIGSVESLGKNIKVDNGELIGGIVNIGIPRPIDKTIEVGANTNIGSSEHSEPIEYEYVTSVGHNTAEGSRFYKSVFIGNRAGGACVDSGTGAVSSSQNTRESVIIGSYGGNCYQTLTKSIFVDSHLSGGAEFTGGDRNIFFNFKGNLPAQPITSANNTIILGKAFRGGGYQTVLNDFVSLNSWVEGGHNGTDYELGVGINGQSNVFTVNTYAGTCILDGDENCTSGIPVASIGCSIAGGLFCTSDEDLKTDYKRLESVTERIMDIDGVSFNWKKGGNKKSYGFIAQELEVEFPELVRPFNKAKKDSHLMVDYTHLWALLVQAVREQKESIDYIEKVCKAPLKNYSLALERQKKLEAEARVLSAELRELRQIVAFELEGKGD